MPTEKRVQTRSHIVQILWGTILLLSGLFPQLGWAQATLENPQPDSFQSGIGVISGFVCTATLIAIEFDGTATFEAAYGTSRGDTSSVCGDANNGFSLLFNWNLLDDGQHTVRALADGVEFATVTITVTTLGVEFLTGASGAFPLSGFPTPGTDITVRWQQPLQNFVITDGSAGSGGGNSGSGMQVLENPQPGSFQSGVGVISGFVCVASLIEIEFNGIATFEAAYGTSRGDTQGVCGDTNNGFSLLFNWNLLGNGVHTVRALADGVEFANVTITVTTFGVEFLTGANGEFTLTDFPEAGTDVVIQWQQPLQNFVITQVTTCEPGDLVCQGEFTFATGNLRDANVAFLQAVAANPTDPQANLYSSMTRILTTVLDDPDLTSFASSSKATSNLLKSLASRSGVVSTGDSRDVCAMSITLPEAVPPGAPRTGEIIHTLRTVLLPEIVAALESLNRISSTAEIRFDLMNLPECLRPMTERFEVEIDGSDIQALRAALQLAQAAFEAAEAYDLDADLQLVTTQTSRAILDAEPTLLNLLSSASLTAARNLVEQALTNASMAIDSVFLETDDQSDDVLAILPEDTLDAERTRDTLDLVRQSLQGTVTLPTDIGFDEPQRLDLSLFFSGSFGTLRPFIPTFDNLGCTATSVPATLTGELSSGDAGSLFRGRTGDGGIQFPLGYFSDPTFGRIAPDLRQKDITGVLSGPKIHSADCFTFSGSARQQILIRAQSENFRPFLGMVGPDGQKVDSSGFCQGDFSRSACLPSDTLQGGLITLSSTGTYTVEVTSNSAKRDDNESDECQPDSGGECEFGSYSLTLVEKSSIPATIVTGLTPVDFVNPTIERFHDPDMLYSSLETFFDYENGMVFRNLEGDNTWASCLCTTGMCNDEGFFSFTGGRNGSADRLFATINLPRPTTFELSFAGGINRFGFYGAETTSEPSCSVLTGDGILNLEFYDQSDTLIDAVTVATGGALPWNQFHGFSATALISRVVFRNVGFMVMDDVYFELRF